MNPARKRQASQLLDYALANTHASARVRADPADNQNAEHKLNNGAKGTILTSRTLSTRPCHLGRPVTNSTPRREKKEN